jgi:hypothetical protein
LTTATDLLSGTEHNLLSEVGYDRPLRTPGSGVLAVYLHEISTTRMDLAFLFVSAFAASTIVTIPV